MAKAKSEPARPYFVVKREFIEAQERLEFAAGSLFNVVEIIRDHLVDKLRPEVLTQLDERLTAFRAAAYGEE